MSEMVRRVERSIRGMFPQGDGESDGAEAVARAAIEAMREPTKAMIDAGEVYAEYAIEAAWKEMIDSALKDDK